MPETLSSRNLSSANTTTEEIPAGTDGRDLTSEHSLSEPDRETLDRRTVLQASALTGAMLAGFGGVGSVSGATTSAGDTLWSYGEEELDCSPPPATFEAPLTVVDGRVYAGTTCTHMHIIDAATGDPAVDAATGEGDETIYTQSTTNTAPNVVNDIVVSTPNNQELIAYDLLEEEARTKTIWEADVGGSVNTFVSAPTVSQGTVYVSNHDGPPYLYALDLWTGEQQWTYDEHELGESPVVADGVVYVSGRDGVVVALDADSGDVEWTADIGETSESAGTVADGTVYVGSDDNNLYALDAATGDEQWRFETGSEVVSTPTVRNGTVYVSSNDGHLYAVEAASGDEKWQFETGEFTGSPTVADGTVFVGSQGGRLFALDAASGEEQWRFEETELDDELFPRIVSPIVVDGVVYAASTDGQDGRVYALDAGVSGSSEDSRVLLGTAGHHDAWADTAATQRRPDESDANGTDLDGTSSSDGTGGGSGDDSGDWEGDGSDSSVQNDDENGVGFGVASALAGLGGFGYLLARRAASGRVER